MGTWKCSCGKEFDNVKDCLNCCDYEEYSLKDGRDAMNIIKDEIKFLEEWLDMYSEGEGRMLVCEEDIADRIKYLRTLLN